METQGNGGYFARRLTDPTVAEGVRAERERIDAIDRIIRGLDEERERQGLSKADLARLTNKRAEFVRRLFTAECPNPTLDTVIEVARALGLEVTLSPST